MNPPSVDLAAMLDAPSGSPLTLGTNLFVSYEPDSPDLCVTLFDSGGFPPDASVNYERPTVMARIRGAKGGYAAAYARAEYIKTVLDRNGHETVNGTVYTGIWAMGDINSLGYDENERPVFSLNFRIHRTPST